MGLVIDEVRDDPDLRRLVAAQEAEVMARYGVDDAGPGVAPGTPCLLARLDGRPVGCVAVGSLAEDVGEVERLYVDPSARGHRVGRRLMARVEQLAVRRGYRALRLETGTEQPEALRLYEATGWGRIPCYGWFREDPSTLCFEKTLDHECRSSPGRR